MVSVILDGHRLVFEGTVRRPGTGCVIDLGADAQIVKTSSSGVLVEVCPIGKKMSTCRQMFKYDNYGTRIVTIFAFTDAVIDVSESNREYYINGVERICNDVISRINVSTDGELVLLQHADSSDPGRNVYRYNQDSTLRWQLAARDYRPRDEVLSAEFMQSGNVLIRAWENGWSAEVDDKTGVMLRVVDDSLRF